MQHESAAPATRCGRGRLMPGQNGAIQKIGGELVQQKGGVSATKGGS